MLRFVFLMVVLALFTHCTEGRPPVRADGTKPADAGTPVVQTSTMAGPEASGDSPAQKAYVDPATDELTPRPIQQDAPAKKDSIKPATVGTSREALEVIPSPVEGGGVMIDLKGRYQSPVSATVDGDNAATIEHSANGKTE